MTGSPTPPLGNEPPPGLSVQLFSDIVGGVYECALEPAKWPQALARVCEAVGGPAGWIAMHQPRLVRSSYEVQYGTDPEWQRRLGEQYVAVSPFIGITHHVRVGEVWSVADIIDYEDFLQSRFYLEWSHPQGWDDTVMGVLTKTTERFTWLGVCLNGRADEAHKTRVAHFLPHVERALRISQLLEFRAAQSADLIAAVENLATGLVIIGADFKVRGINPAAERLIRETGALSHHNGRLDGSSAEGGTALAEALAGCAGSRLDRAGVSLLLPARDGEVGLLVQVVPLPRRTTARRDEAIAAVFLQAPSEPAVAPMDAFVRHFGLTPSETRVLLAILRGETPRSIATANGLAMPTIRTHLSRLYNKTATGGQTDLIRLTASMTTASG